MKYSGLPELIVFGVVDAYKTYFGTTTMTGRSHQGLLLEFYLHLYMYYYKVSDWERAEIIDFESTYNGATSQTKFFENRFFLGRSRYAASLIIRDSIINNIEMRWLSWAIKLYFDS